jgi:uncharacterized ferredoxin-like protein
MGIITEESIREKVVLRVAEQMLTSARTAPKARGLDSLYMAIITQEEKQKIADLMKKIAEEKQVSFFARDAVNLENAQALVLIGTKISPLGLKACSYCGFNNCDEKLENPDIPCTFNNVDLGIAIGSAVSIASQNNVDNRVFFSAGYAAIKGRFIPKEVKIAFGIPLSVSSKSIFFDRLKNT